MTNYAGSDPAALQKASPITYVQADVAPLFIIASDHDAMPPEQYNDLIKKLNAVGATISRSSSARTVRRTLRLLAGREGAVSRFLER